MGICALLLYVTTTVADPSNLFSQNTFLSAASCCSVGLSHPLGTKFSHVPIAKVACTSPSKQLYRTGIVLNASRQIE